MSALFIVAALLSAFASGAASASAYHAERWRLYRRRFLATPIPPTTGRNPARDPAAGSSE